MTPRIASLLPSATEMVYALGKGELLVARSHECDFPPEVRALPVVTAPKLDIDASSKTIERDVRTLVRDAVAVYSVDTDALENSRPDIIITQTQCDVCAVSLRDVEQAVRRMLSSRPKIVALEPITLADVFTDLRRVAEAIGASAQGRALEETLRHRMHSLSIRAAAQRGSRPAPTIACIEWLDPLMGAGNWMPTLVDLAGGRAVLGAAGTHSPYVTFDDLAAADPDVILIVPCGFALARTRAELPAFVDRPGWSELRAVQHGRVYLADGNQYFNRPGPRIVESMEILVEILHEANEGFELGHHGAAWERWSPLVERSDTLRAEVADELTRSSMALESIRVSAIIPATAQTLYEAWIDGERHSEITGSAATVEAHVGGRHTAWDGYIEGTMLALEPARRIVQSWRSLDFPDGAVDSRLEVLLVPATGGTEVTLVHTDIPEGQSADYETAWFDHYFKPMQSFYAPRPAPVVLKSVPKAAALAPAKKRAAPAVAKKKKKSPKKKSPKKKSPAKKAAKTAPSKRVAKKPARPHKKPARKK